MQESDYFEDFGETQEIMDEDEDIKNMSKKGKKNKSKQGSDKLMGELETLALGEENDVSNVLVRSFKMNCIIHLFCLFIYYYSHEVCIK